MVDFLLGRCRVKYQHLIFFQIPTYLTLDATIFLDHFFHRDYENKTNRKRVIYKFVHGRKFFLRVITEPMKRNILLE